MSIKKSFAFAFIVTMVAMALDMMFHMAGESLFGVAIAVHLPYVLVKTTVVFGHFFGFRIGWA